MTETTTTTHALPEVAAYLELSAQAERMHDHIHTVLTRMYPLRYQHSTEGLQQREAYRLQTAEYTSRREALEAQAVEQLHACADPLVQWLVNSPALTRFPSHARTLLKALPATVEELDEMARRNDWCEVWEDYRDEMQQAGVLPGLPPRSPARQELYAWVLEMIGTGDSPDRSDRDDLDRLIAVVADEGATSA